MTDKAELLINELVAASIAFGRGVEPDWQTRIETAQRELREYIVELEAERRWIPVSERLPEEKQKILITWAPKYSQIFSAIFGTGFTDWTFTHWMPRPPNPESPNDTQTQTIVYGKESEE